MDRRNSKDRRGDQPVMIDYENIDVASIMEQVRARIASRPKSPIPEEELSPEAPSYPTQGVFPPPPDEPPGPKGKVKRLLLKVMRPFSPLIKLLIFPVYAELRETIRSLDQTNRRLDLLNATLEVELRNLRTHVDGKFGSAHERLDLTFENLKRTIEHTKLLHGLSHNIVVELTKLKIEEEGLKSKTRIMEKDFEFLGKRERALEKHVFK